MTMQPELVHDPVPDLLICKCIDGVLAISREINFLHTEPLHDVVRLYSKVFHCLVFLRTDASTKEIAWLATRQHENDILWMFAKPFMPPECLSFIRILAISTAEAVAAIEARGPEDMNLDKGLRALRWSLQDIRKAATNKMEVPKLPSSDDITLCGCRAVVCFRRDRVIKDSDGSWRVANKSETLSTPSIKIKASAKQLLWLSKYPSFSRVLCALRDCFGATGVEVQRFLALDAAVNLGTFRDKYEDWVKDTGTFIHELEHMLVEGVTFPEE